MGFMGKIKKTVGGKVGKAEGAVTKAADMVDRRTGHKYSDKIDKVVDKGLDAADKLDGKVDREPRSLPEVDRRPEGIE